MHTVVEVVTTNVSVVDEHMQLAMRIGVPVGVDLDLLAVDGSGTKVVTDLVQLRVEIWKSDLTLSARESEGGGGYVVRTSHCSSVRPRFLESVVGLKRHVVLVELKESGMVWLQ